MVAFGCLALFSVNCQKKEAEAPRDPLAQGRSFYMSHCIACHNPNPTKDGSIGPAIWGSSKELLRSKVLRSEYPNGYAPKRKTHIMPKLPLTEEDIEVVRVFLNAAT